MARKQRKPRSRDKPASQGEPRLSPEVDLLEYLSGGDQPLDQAKLPFPSLEQAQRAVMVFVKAGLADLFVLEGGAETPVPDWQLAAIVNDAGNWEPSDNPRYLLRLTAKGHAQFVDDSERFFDELFGG